MSDVNTTVVTGAGSGVGRAVALKFAGEGWNVALVGRRARRAGRNRGPRRGRRRIADGRLLLRRQRRPRPSRRWATAVLARFGRVDVLVNAAGINVPQRSFQKLSLDDWHAVLATNLHGAYYCVRAFLPSMRERGDGTIVNINSDVGKIARDLAGPAYVSSKFGLMGLTQQINAEERGHGIRACSICPRDVNTPLLDKRPQPPSAGSPRAHAAARGSRRLRVARRHAAAPRRHGRDLAVQSMKWLCSQSTPDAADVQEIGVGALLRAADVDEHDERAGARAAARRSISPSRRSRLVSFERNGWTPHHIASDAGQLERWASPPESALTAAAPRAAARCLPSCVTATIAARLRRRRQRDRRLAQRRTVQAGRRVNRRQRVLEGGDRLGVADESRRASARRAPGTRRPRFRRPA